MGKCLRDKGLKYLKNHSSGYVYPSYRIILGSDSSKTT